MTSREIKEENIQNKVGKEFTQTQEEHLWEDKDWRRLCQDRKSGHRYKNSAYKRIRRLCDKRERVDTDTRGVLMEG